MSTSKAAAKTAKTKTASTKASAGQAATPAAEKEVLWQCKVLEQANKKLVKIGNMWCGKGAKAALTKEKADALAAEGMVEILGIA